MEEIKAPEIGQKIYIPSAMYIDHGRDDIQGGLATIDAIKPYGHGRNDWMISVAELRPRNILWGYRDLMKQQDALRKDHGDEIARQDPDNSAESNPPNYGWDD
jgi:hypothetical protein